MVIPLPSPPAGVSTVDFHKGEMLVHASNTYQKLPQTILEMVQNGIDVDATRIVVVIDLAKRKVAVLDNGTGTDRRMFETALASVGHSTKNSGRGSKRSNTNLETLRLGKFGLGLISPLSKCRYFTFTSAPMGRRAALRWTFAKDAIIEQRDSVQIPCAPLRVMPTPSTRYMNYLTGDFDVSYQTIVELHDVTTDRVISLIDIDELSAMIRAKFAIPMRIRKVVVKVILIDTNDRRKVSDVSPLQFTGEPMPVIPFFDGDCGEVEFELYRAPRIGGKREGQVLVMAGNDLSPITIKEFVAQAKRNHMGDILSDAMDVLSSGYFEGIIRAE
jgi:hypothetical protein